MENAVGKIIDLDENLITVQVPTQHININNLSKRRYEKVTVVFHDGRYISAEQRRKAYVLIGAIADFTGDTVEGEKERLKWEFIKNRHTDIAKKLFSLSDCSMTTAKEFISYTIDFMLEHDIGQGLQLSKHCDDIEKYVYSCLIHKKCAVCNKPAECHHWDAVGMGRDRSNICHVGMKAIPLCREHHTIAHTKGKSWLIDEQHLMPIAIDEQIAKVYKLKKER